MKKLFLKIKNGIQNIFIWLPIIWNDRQWDHFYLYEMLLKKLTLMEKYHTNSNNFVGQNKIAKQIKLCRLLCQRIVDDRYIINATKPVENKYGEWSFESELCEDGFCRRLVDNRTEKERVAYKRAYNLSDYLRQQDKEMLFDKLNKWLDCWWD